MTKKPDRRALGRGLSALLGDTAAETEVARSPSAARGIEGQAGDQVPRIPIDLISANPEQPRKTFRDAELDELARSIKDRGVIQPIIVRPDPSNPGHYQIVAGERRWRAAQRANVHVLPAIVREIGDREMLELALIENIQRVDLDPIEEAQGYSQLLEQFDYTQEELANVLGKSRSHLANIMRLLSLPEPVQTMVRNRTLSAGHARALITAHDPVGLAEQAVLKSMTVRQVEALAKKLPPSLTVKSGPKKPEKDADTRMLEGDLSANIGMKVTIEHMTADGGGQMVIRYKSLDDLDRLCRKLAE